MELNKSLVYDVDGFGGIFKHQYYIVRVAGCNGFFKIYNLRGAENEIINS